MTEYLNTIDVSTLISEIFFLPVLDYLKNNMTVTSNNNIINTIIINKNNKKSFDAFVRILLLFTTRTSLTTILDNEAYVSDNYENIITDKTTLLDVLKILSTIQLNNVSFGLTYFFSNEKYITIKTTNVSNKIVNDYKVNYPIAIKKLSIINLLRKSNFFSTKKHINNQLQFVSNKKSYYFELILN
jgi:hypothetical protein